MDHKGFSTSPQCAACALGSTLLVEKISNQEMICIHIFLMCLLFVDLSVGAKMSNTGFLQREKRFSQFKTVKVAEVWNDLKSSKVVSYTLTRDLTVVGENFETTVIFSQFLFVQMMWLTLHLLFWRGSITENRWVKSVCQLSTVQVYLRICDVWPNALKYVCQLLIKTGALATLASTMTQTEGWTSPRLRTFSWTQRQCPGTWWSAVAL